MTGLPGHAFGTTPPPFEIAEILLYRLRFTRSSWDCSYASGGGSFTSYSDIDDFITDLKNASLPPPDGLLPLNSSDAAPDLVVRVPCYVVIVLTSDDDATLSFQADDPALTTAPARSGDYFGLTRAYNDSDGNCRTVFFAVPSPKPIALGRNDPYNLFLQYVASSTEQTHVIDPAIKNRGGGH